MMVNFLEINQIAVLIFELGQTVVAYNRVIDETNFSDFVNNFYDAKK